TAVPYFDLLLIPDGDFFRLFDRLKDRQAFKRRLFDSRHLIKVKDAIIPKHRNIVFLILWCGILCRFFQELPENYHLCALAFDVAAQGLNLLERKPIIRIKTALEPRNSEQERIDSAIRFLRNETRSDSHAIG